MSTHFSNRGFVMIRRGLEDHIVAGKISAFETGVYLIVHLQADYRTGIWTGSAARLQATAPRGAKLRDMQRPLRRLSLAGFIRAFHRHGVRGNYRVLIDKFEPPSGALKGYRLNAWKSESWERPSYEPCAVDDAVRGGVGAPYQEEENKQRQTPPSEAKTASDRVTVPPPRDSARKSKRLASEAALRLARLLHDRIVANNPTAKLTEQNVAAWGRDVDLMIQRDRRTEPQIYELICWSQGDSFWRTNILSMAKLREKFDQLTLKKQHNEKGGLGRAEQRDRHNLATAGFTN